MIHAVTLGLGLVSLWLLMSGHYTPLLLSFGAASCIFVVLIARRMDVTDREAVPLQLTVGVFGYWVWLVKEIAKANYDVTRLILDPKLPISPRMIRVPASQKSDLGLVVHANSITLTPGTVTVELSDRIILSPFAPVAGAAAPT